MILSLIRRRTHNSIYAKLFHWSNSLLLNFLALGNLPISNDLPLPSNQLQFALSRLLYNLRIENGVSACYGFITITTPMQLKIRKLTGLGERCVEFEHAQLNQTLCIGLPPFKPNELLRKVSSLCQDCVSTTRSVRRQSDEINFALKDQTHFT